MPKKETVSELVSLPLEHKISYAKAKVMEWYEHWNGQVYVSFSGGKDSNVMGRIVRTIYPDVPFVFCNTGQEHPEIVKFVRTIENVVWLTPEKSFVEACRSYGYPLISKEVSMAVSRYRNTKCQHQRDLRLHGGVNKNTGRDQSTGVIPKKYHSILQTDIRISEACCTYLKKRPFEKYEKLTGRKPFVGTTYFDSHQRQRDYLKFGCNAFDKKKPQSRPLSIFREEEILYLNSILPHCVLYDQGVTRTGCMLCGFGPPDVVLKRFYAIKCQYPKLYEMLDREFDFKKILGWYLTP